MSPKAIEEVFPICSLVTWQIKLPVLISFIALQASWAVDRATAAEFTIPQTSSGSQSPPSQQKKGQHLPSSYLCGSQFTILRCGVALEGLLYPPLAMVIA